MLSNMCNLPSINIRMQELNARNTLTFFIFKVPFLCIFEAVGSQTLAHAYVHVSFYNTIF